MDTVTVDTAFILFEFELLAGGRFLGTVLRGAYGTEKYKQKYNIILNNITNMAGFTTIRLEEYNNLYATMTITNHEEEHFCTVHCII